MQGVALEQLGSLGLQTWIGKELATTTKSCPPGGDGSGPRIRKEEVHLDSHLQFKVKLCNLRWKQKGRVSVGLKRGLGGMD